MKKQKQYLRKHSKKEASFSANAVTDFEIDFEMETFEPVLSIQRITGSYRNAVLPKKGATEIFSDSIPKGMNSKSINKQVKGGRIYIKAFPGAKSAQLIYTFYRHLKNIAMAQLSYMSELMTY